MTASRSARERKAASEAGPLARVRIDLGADKSFIYKITCSECVVGGGRSWSAYRSGGDNGFMAAMDRWIFHLKEKHPGTDAPCMAFLPAAQQRLHQCREKQDGDGPTTTSGSGDT
jgi:hypothetical protein